MGKESRKKTVRMQALLMCVLLVFCGCQPAKTVSAPLSEYTYAPEVTPESTPGPINPVMAFFDSFLKALDPLISELADSEEYLAYSLTIDTHIQRQQQFFLALSELSFSDEDVWDGMLIGAFSGSGAISGNEKDARFSCSLWDGTKIEGYISSGVMEAEWKYPETIDIEGETYEAENGEIIERAPESVTEWHIFRTAKIWKTDEGYYSSLIYDDGSSLLYIEGDCLYYSDKTPTPGNMISDWAVWGYMSGKIMKYESANQALIE